MDCRDTDKGILIPYLFFIKMKNLVGWKLYFSDGNSIDSNQMKFNDAPTGGVQAFILWYEVSKNKYDAEIQHSLHLYTLDSNSNGKIGQNIREGRFEEILNIARTDKVPVINMED